MCRIAESYGERKGQAVILKEPEIVGMHETKRNEHHVRVVERGDKA